MTVPPFVPADGPAADTAEADPCACHAPLQSGFKTSSKPHSKAGTKPRSRSRPEPPSGAAAASYVSPTAGGWRFQWRLPAHFALASGPSTIRAALGPRSRPDARRMGQQLAALCTAVCDAALLTQPEADMTMTPLDEKETALVRQVVDACQQAIKTAVNQPSRAIGLAKGLDAALTSLRLVQAEIGKGESGARAVIDNADAISRAALKDVLKHASDPHLAQKVLNTTLDIPRSLTSEAALMRPGSGAASTLPTFGAISQRYINMRVANGAKRGEVQRLCFSRSSFIALVGDRPIDTYFPSDLQSYVTQMQYYPANASKIGALKGLSLPEIVAANNPVKYKPYARKTLQDGFVAFIRTEARAGIADHHYRDPFAGVEIRWPAILRPSVPRVSLGLDALNRIFRQGVASGQLDEAMLPLLSFLTSRRLGLLAYMCGSDIRERYGVTVAQVEGVVKVGDQWQTRPIKTDESGGFFVLHNFLTKIGFTAWAAQQDGWVFATLHEHTDPSKYISKVMNRLLVRCGATAAGEVFHSLRGEAIDAMRAADMSDRAKRLQAGHDLGDVHEQYGFSTLSEVECQRLASLPLAKEIDWSVFEGLDFDAMAKRRRERGRPRRGR